MVHRNSLCLGTNKFAIAIPLDPFTPLILHLYTNAVQTLTLDLCCLPQFGRERVLQQQQQQPTRLLKRSAMGKVHGSLARAGKVRGQTPKVAKQDKKKKPRGRAYKRMQYNRRFVTAVVGFGKKRGPNSSEK
ncbi:hypothetical protein AB3S75_019461 [Citrus x aurantiifolia]